MKPISLGELAEKMGGGVVGADPGRVVERVVLDSREVLPGSLFVAIRGTQVDGHHFAEQAISAGAVAVLAEQDVAVPHVRVTNVVQALANWARGIRDSFTGPVAGVTGSYGKTSTKEFLAAALSPLGKVAKTPGNRNTEYTVPLFWADLEGDEAAAVVEMAMRGFGQIAHLAEFSSPTVGVVTLIGHAHLELVGSQAGIARAKGELLAALPESGTAICWHEDPYLDTLAEMSRAPVWTFGQSAEADLVLSDYRALSPDASQIEMRWEGLREVAVIPALGEHLARNAAAAVLAAVSVGVPFREAIHALRGAELPPMRMQVLKWNGATLLLDAYNAGPESFRAALQTARDLAGDAELLLVMGEMRELGEASEAAHRDLARFALASGVRRAVFMGDSARPAWEEAVASGMSESDARWAEDIDAVRRFLEQVGPGQVVLIKGSRAVGLERALEGLV